jgi:carbamoyltransferase
MAGAFLGPQFSQADIAARLTAAGARYAVSPDIVADTAAELAAGRTVGWFQGRMEFGPRALGARSILADPRSPETQSVVNLKIKNRESFRPFAPAVRREDLAEWFDLDRDSPYMLLVAEVAQCQRLATVEAGEGLARLKTVRSTIPAVTHVDYSARVQTVHPDTNPRFHALLGRFAALTGCPVLLNTSFNVRGEPIVHTPEDAFRCFMGTGIDVLVVGDCLMRKADQDPALMTDHARMYGVD